MLHWETRTSCHPKPRKLWKDLCAVCMDLKKLNSVSEVRKCMFLQKYANSCSSLNLSTLPQCEQNLQQHIKRASYVAAMNK